MELPKINKDQLTKQLREVVGDNDIEFDAIVDPTDIVIDDFDEDAYNEGRLEVAQKLVEIRKEIQKDLRRKEHLTDM
tara:strand:- start:2632 stop:2862 length:231 start_codon:yes stop_codon:yes gene_type:complete